MCEVKRDDCPGLPGIVCVATEELPQRRDARGCSVGWLRQFGWCDSELYDPTPQQLTCIGMHRGNGAIGNKALREPIKLA